MFYIVANKELKFGGGGCFVFRYICRLMFQSMKFYYMIKCEELKDCKMGGTKKKRNKNRFPSNKFTILLFSE